MRRRGGPSGSATTRRSGAITHQWLQVHLLAGLAAVASVLEVGPGLGLVSAMLGNVSGRISR